MFNTLLPATPIAARVAAVLSAHCAFLSYRLSKKIQDALKADETIIIGPLLNPTLRHESHSNCVVVCTLFNKSRRKAYVRSVRATVEDREEVDISWYQLGVKYRPERKPRRAIRVDGAHRIH